jgi:hypothetical protein
LRGKRAPTESGSETDAGAAAAASALVANYNLGFFELFIHRRTRAKSESPSAKRGGSEFAVEFFVRLKSVFVQ